jgi:hypothetical protein
MNRRRLPASRAHGLRRGLRGTKNPSRILNPGGVSRRLGAARPPISPTGDLAGEAPVADRGDDQAAARVGGIRLGMARRTEGPPDGRDRSPSRPGLGALDDVVDLEGAPAATGLAPPAGAAEHHAADRRPLLEGGGGAPGGARAAPLDSATRRGANAHPRPKRSPQQQRRPRVCPRGQTLLLRITGRFAARWSAPALSIRLR